MFTVRCIVNKFISCMSAAAVAFSCMLSAPAVTSGEEAQRSWAQLADEVGYLVNEARIDAGLEPVRVVPYLNDRANVRASECAVKWDHNRPDGSKFSTVIDRSLVPYSYAAENIAAGLPSPEGTFNDWKASPKHWEAIIDPRYDYIGIGVFYDENSPYGWYWTQIFIDYDGELSGAYFPYSPGPGDLTADGTVNCFDYIILRRRLANKDYALDYYQRDNADLYKDGYINIIDAVVMRGYLLGEYKTLPIYPESFSG
ncbi:MAG: SCP-like extracellular [Ruminococcus sp.]|nr:SCP-like extracellular [Ruminococcus sp.]